MTDLSKFSRLNLSTKLSWQSSVDKIQSMKFRWWNFDDNISSKEFIHRNSVDKINSMNRVFDELGSIRWNKNRYMAVIIANLKLLASVNNKKIIRCKTESADARNHQRHREDLLLDEYFWWCLNAGRKIGEWFYNIFAFLSIEAGLRFGLSHPRPRPLDPPRPCPVTHPPNGMQQPQDFFFLQAGF